MKKLKAAIIGLGVGEQHIAGYQNHPNCEVVMLCDLSTVKLEKMQQKYPHAILTMSADEVLENPTIDVVSIASYDNDHYPQIIQGIRHDKHLFVEKPVCLYEHEATHIRAMLREKPHLRVSSNLILRKYPRFEKLRGMIRSGEFGKLFYLEGDYNYGRLHKITDGWRGRLEFYSVIYGGAVHIVDLLLWLTEDRVVEVCAYGNKIASQYSAFRYNDFVACLLKFESGLIGKITANFACVFPHFHQLVIYGTQKTFVNDREYGKLFESRDPQVTPREMATAYPGAHKGDLLYNFIDAIIHDMPAIVSTDDVFTTMSVCFAIEKATHQSSTVSVTYL